MAVLGHKADLGVMALGPDLARLRRSSRSCSTAPLEPVYSYVSLTEQSEYGATEDDERARLASEEGLTGDEIEQRLAAWRERIAHYREQRIHPQLPAEAACAASTRCRSAATRRRELVRAARSRSARS